MRLLVRRRVVGRRIVFLPTTGGAPAASAPTAAAADGCPDATKVGPALGANLQSPTVFTAAIGVTCQYTGRWAADNKSAFVTVTIQNAETDAAWAKYREDAKGIGKNIKDIPNLGDDPIHVHVFGCAAVDLH